jgi:hypothetical protein
MRRVLRSALTAAALLVAATAASGQVAIAPTTVVVGARQPFGSYLLSNASPVPQEVVVDFRFGFPVSDSLGAMTMLYDDSATAARHSMTEWVRAFPRRFVMQPGEQQVVRITVRPPAGLEDGTYWTRIVTTSTPQGPSPEPPAADGVSAHIVLRLEQVTTLLYRHGRQSTGLDPGEIVVVDDDESKALLLPLSRSGNAPYMGTALLRVRNADGDVVHESTDLLAIYFDLVKRFELPRGLTSGSYTAEIALTAARRDIPSSDLVQAPPASRSVTFRVP